VTSTALDDIPNFGERDQRYEEDGEPAACPLEDALAIGATSRASEVHRSQCLQPNIDSEDEQHAPIVLDLSVNRVIRAAKCHTEMAQTRPNMPCMEASLLVNKMT
jgi:hypothetical protein